MPTTANITPTPLTDGIVYANNVPVTITEAALGDGVDTPSNGIVPVIEGQTVIAVVKLTCAGHLTANSGFVFLQTDLGDGNWVDVAWCRTTITDGSATFVLCGGGLGSINNAFGPLRQSGSAPNPNASGSNACPLGGRIRFTGFGSSVGGSSVVSGTLGYGMLATITFRIQEPR